MKRSRDVPLMLCVDDDPLVLKSLERLFHKEPVELLSTFQPELALKWVKEHAVDLLVTDQRMPGITGTKLIEAVLACSPSTTCILLTAYPLDAAVLSSFIQGPYGLISKPWDGPMLKAAIRQIIRERDIEDLEDRMMSGE